eukprot:gene24-12836_t
MAEWLDKLTIDGRLESPSSFFLLVLADEQSKELQLGVSCGGQGSVTPQSNFASRSLWWPQGAVERNKQIDAGASITPQESAKLKEYCNYLLARQYIVPSKSSESGMAFWFAAGPVVEEGSMYIDYAILKSITIASDVTLPTNAEMKAHRMQFGDDGFVSLLKLRNLADAFYLLPGSASRDMSTFALPDGSKYAWKVAAFDLPYSEYDMHQVLEGIFKGMHGVKVCIDTIVIASKAKEDALQGLSEELLALSKNMEVEMLMSTLMVKRFPPSHSGTGC